ncbi:MAG: TolC family protein [Phycisphaerae bacterium]
MKLNRLGPFCLIPEIAAGLILSIGLSGCTPAQYARQADAVAYGVISYGREVVGDPSPSTDYSVSYDPYMAGADGQIVLNDKQIPLRAGEAVMLELTDCVEIALANSRAFQDRREELYRAALFLGTSRRDWNWQLVQGQLAGDIFGQRIGNEGQAGEQLVATSDSEVSLTRRFAQGGVLALAATLQVVSDLLGGTDTTVGSALSASFTQPLLQGAWRGIAYEAQYRRERDFLFTLFEYDRFTQTFVANVFSQYWRVLQQRDELENETENIRRLQQTLELTRVQVRGGQVSPIQQDQAEQNLLDARIRQQRQQQAYRDSLDSYKLLLGLPLVARIRLNYPDALLELRSMATEAGQLPPLPLDETDAVEVALMSRPEVMRSRAALRDADRNITLAADEFLPQLDLQLGLAVPGTEETEFYRLQPHRSQRTARLEFHYPIDQTANRNNYRNALIALNRAKRQLDLLEDEIALDVRQTYRELLRTSRTYQLQLRSFQIAERRRKLAVLQQKQGQASARDVLEAEEALRNSQNGLTAAIVAYTTTRLRFLATLGMIGADEEGLIYERPDPIRFDRLARRYEYLRQHPPSSPAEDEEG